MLRTSALLLLTGCGTQQKPLVDYQTLNQPKIPLATELISLIEVPYPPLPMTFGDSVRLNAELYGQCNIDREAILRIQSK